MSPVHCPRCKGPLANPRRSHRQGAYELFGPDVDLERVVPPSSDGARPCPRCGRVWFVRDGNVVDNEEVAAGDAALDEFLRSRGTTGD